MAQEFENVNNVLKIIQDGLINTVPEPKFFFANKIKFKKADMVGQYYAAAIQSQLEQAVTPGGNTRLAYDLKVANAGTIDQLQITPYEATNRAEMSKGMLNASEGGGNKAYADVSKNRTKAMLDALRIHQEIDYRYGQKPKMTYDEAANATAETSGQFAATLTLDEAEYSIGILSSTQNARVEFWNSAGNQIANTGTAYYRHMVNFARGTRTALFEFTDQTDRDAVVADTDVEVWFEGERTGAAAYDEKVGLDKIITTSTGTLFNVDLDKNDLFRGNTFAVGALTNKKLNMLMIMDALTIPMGLGLSGKTVNMHIAPWHYPGLVDDESALRRYSAEKSAVNGFQSISFLFGDVKINIIVDPYIKLGEAIAYCQEEVRRIGTHDVKLEEFLLSNKNSYIHKVANKNSYEVLGSVDDAIFTEQPKSTVKITGLDPDGTAYTGS
jgi:hypothetical protein